MAASLALATLALCAALIASADAGPRLRHEPRAEGTPPFVRVEDAAYHTLCEFEIHEEVDEERVPRVVRHLDCVPAERRRGRPCCGRAHHECVQLLSSITVHVAGVKQPMQQRAGCACMNTQYITSRPAAPPSPG